VSFEESNESNGFQPANDIPVTELQKPAMAESDARTVIALKKWGQPQIARRIFRLLPTVNQRNGQSTWVESFKMALDLRDFSYGLKAPSVPDSPLRAIPNSALHLEEHMSKYSSDWKMLYPYAYREAVETFGAVAAIDPFLVLGVMRAESVYDVDARSIVGARGLMQIMPFTAVRIARMMADGRFELPDLHRPEVNIGYGAYYLRKLADYYKGNNLLAVAAYNGGPVSVDRWVQAYGNLEADEFVETIPFRETRRYVKSVLRNFNQYKNVWQQSKALADLPKVPSELDGGEIF
jgi:soluble lytic murein transglycosylase-like protein